MTYQILKTIITISFKELSIIINSVYSLKYITALYTCVPRNVLMYGHYDEIKIASPLIAVAPSILPFHYTEVV